MIYSTLSATDSIAAVVTEDFISGASWNETKINATDSNTLGMVRALQNEISGLKRLENAECIRTYGVSKVISDWKNFLVVTDLNSTRNDSLYAAYEHSTDSGYSDDFSWMCNTSVYESCDISEMLKHAEEWTITGVESETYHYRYRDVKIPPKLSSTYGPEYVASVQYCLAEVVEPHCKVDVSMHLLGLVIVCNVLKAGCLLYTLFMNVDFKPLATVGDAISSFIEDPDKTTRGKGPLSALDVRRGHWRKNDRTLMKAVKSWGTYVRVPESLQRLMRSFTRNTSDTWELLARPTRPSPYSQVWNRNTRRWFRSVSIERWALCVLL